MIRDILKDPDPNLYVKSAPIDAGYDSSAIIQDLMDTCEIHNGLGLAAPQIGYLLRAVVIKRNDGSMLGIVNPKIVKRSGVKINSSESCFSVPGKTVTRKRAYSVRVVGDGVDVELKDKESCVFQHEYDHLEGVTIANVKSSS